MGANRSFLPLPVTLSLLTFVGVWLMTSAAFLSIKGRVARHDLLFGLRPRPIFG